MTLANTSTTIQWLFIKTLSVAPVMECPGGCRTK